jgi:branched-chain amino acid transport system ATP-binding protein
VETGPALRIDGVAKSFGGFRALQDISMTVRPGEVRAIIGPNGAGKTTLVNVVSGLLAPSSGRIFLAGREITPLSPHARARLGLLRTFQITSLFPGLTVAEHLDVAVRAAHAYRVQRGGTDATPRAAVASLLEQMGLEGVAAITADKLSHGDQRVLEVAMSLACRPSVLLLDEPTAGMSIVETGSMIQLVNTQLRGRVTIVIIEHDMDVVMQTADQITVIAAGRVLAEGPPEAVRADPKVREVYLGTAGH